MSSITLQNGQGQTIELKRGEQAGVIHIRHTRVHPTNFGRYYEFAERSKHPPIASFLAKQAMEIKAADGVGGAYAIIDHRDALLDATEVALIRDAVKKLEGKSSQV